MKEMSRVFVRLSTIICLLTVITLILAEEEETTSESTFETCLDELKQAVDSKSEDEEGNDYEPELSLAESIRIFDECLSREGITLSIHGTQGEGNAANSATGNAGERASIEGSSNETESSAQQGANGEDVPPSDSNDLESSLHNFDTMLSQIQDEMDAERAEQLAQEERKANEIAQSAQNTNAEQQENNEDQSEGSLAKPSTTASAEAKHKDPKTRTPLDPKDEDIVLKTIREAAELETNPTTRQALWDQYYDYADKNK